MYKKIHFIGIGGIGMSALARYYLSCGVSVSGSDGVDSEILRDLKREGVKTFVGHDESQIEDDVDLVIYTLAISEDNVELLKAKNLVGGNSSLIMGVGAVNVKILTYAQALGEMSKEKRVIAVCGTHGKTTTTAMCFYALREAGLNVSMILGSLIEYEGKNTNYISHINKERKMAGDTDLDYIVIEACEYKRSFLNYNPEIILVTNIDADHLDYFKDLKDVENAFQEFTDRLTENGKLIAHENEFNILSVNKSEKESQEKINADLSADKEGIILSVPGTHNRENAQLVLALGEALNLDKEKIKAGLKKFKGTWRRQEYKGKYFGMECYDDYAHHPTEVAATLAAFKEKNKIEAENLKTKEKKIIVAFMPHLYSRTKVFKDEFVKVLSLADQVLLLPIYAAREAFDASVSSEILRDEINKFSNISQLENGKVIDKARCFGSIESLRGYLNSKDIKNKEDCMLITMGAGDIYKIYE